MDDFIFDDFSHTEEKQEDRFYYFLSNDPDINYDDFGIASKQCELEDTFDTEENKDFQNVKIQEQKFTEGLYDYESKKKNKIQVNSLSVKNKYYEAKKGKNTETSGLMMNSKTLIKKALEKGDSSQEETISFQENMDSLNSKTISLEILRKILGVEEKDSKSIFIRRDSDEMRRKIVSKLSDSWTPQQIMSNTKMSLQGKLMSIKYIEVLRKGCIKPQQFNTWKND